MTVRAELRKTMVKTLEEHQQAAGSLENQFAVIEDIAGLMARAIQSGRTIFWCGNGGSAADCQHLAAELVGRFERTRKGLASVALTTDSSILTSVSNDFGFECVFARQVEALCGPGDFVVGISTTGNSPNVCAALAKAREIGCQTFAMTGETGGRLMTLADHCLRVPSASTARVQEVHILAGHMLCDLIEAEICEAHESAK